LPGRVLVVDDSAVIRQLISVNLELEGFEVMTAADGAECLEVVHGVRPDVVTLDVVMPRLDGLRTAARLRSDPRTRDVPIAIVSACTRLDLEQGRSVGVDAYLGKPFEPVDLVRLVHRLVGMSGGMRRDGAAQEAAATAYASGVILGSGYVGIEPTGSGGAGVEAVPRRARGFEGDPVEPLDPSRPRESRGARTSHLCVPPALVDAALVDEPAASPAGATELADGDSRATSGQVSCVGRAVVHRSGLSHSP
jgi:CheY-like chemotaxis protein